MDIFVTRPSMPDFDDFVEEIKPIFNSHILTNSGPIYKKFQHKLMQYMQVPEVSLFANGHFALEMAIQALGLNIPNGEIITTPFTFVSTSHAIVRNNLKPIFCDIKPDTYTIDEDQIESKITKNTVAIIPVHVYGNVCNVEKIQKIAEKYNLKVIYDAAHAFGVKYKDQSIGNFGDASMFSFHATKVFNTIEGGCLTFSNKDYKILLHELKNFGIHSQEEILNFGGNAKLDEFRSAMGLANLKNVENSIKKREIVFFRYIERLSKIKGLKIPKIQENVKSNYAYFPIEIIPSEFGETRDELFDRLMSKHIYSRKYFYPAVNDLACYKEKFTDAEPTPNAHNISLNILTLPLYEDLSLQSVDKICDIIGERFL